MSNYYKHVQSWMCNGRCWMVYDSLWFLLSHIYLLGFVFLFILEVYKNGALEFIKIAPTVLNCLIPCLLSHEMCCCVCLWLRKLSWVLASGFRALPCRAVAIETHCTAHIFGSKAFQVSVKRAYTKRVHLINCVIVPMYFHEVQRKSHE